jgi:hypothetical protein
MWKGSVLEGKERLYVCTFVSSCRRNNDVELMLARHRLHRPVSYQGSAYTGRLDRHAK